MWIWIGYLVGMIPGGLVFGYALYEGDFSPKGKNADYATGAIGWPFWLLIVIVFAVACLLEETLGRFLAYIAKLFR